MPRTAALAVAFAVVALAGSAIAQDIDPANPPAEMVQIAWRLPDGNVHLQYTYTAPNACWSAGDTDLKIPPGRRAEFRIVPQMTGTFCAMVMTPLDYSRDLAIGPHVETLLVVVEHPAGGVIEQNELWILGQDEAPR